MSDDSDQNFCKVRGELAYDPDYKTVGADSTPLCRFKIKTAEEYKDKKRVSWVPCVAWRDVADQIGALGKGSRIEIKGGITERTWDKDGVKQYKTEVTANWVDVLWRSEDSDSEDYTPSNDDDSIPF